MTLKLIDKDLRSKYAEALYKNESSYDKEIDRRFQRLNLDYVRSSQNIDAGSQIFLNKVRQKRNKWIQDDMRFREHYRLVCRNVHNKKLDNLKQIFDPQSKPYQIKKLDPKLQQKFQILQEQLNNKDANLTFILNPSAETQIRNQNQKNADIFNVESNSNDVSAKPSTVPRLPEIARMNNNNDDIEEDLYNRYSRSDREFLEKFPSKVELTVTDVGKQYIENEKKKHQTLKRQKQKYVRIQENAVRDPRYNELVSYLRD